MAVEISSAVGAYKSALNRVTDTNEDGSSGIGSNITKNDFSSMVKNFAQGAIDKSVASEQLSAAAAAGKANVDEGVMAVAEAESTLTTVVAIRDKVLEAYREILRMPI